MFSTKAEAVAWAAQRATEIRAGAAKGVQKHRTLGDAFQRYEKEVSVDLCSISRPTFDA
jgi:hypothetical protein